MVANGYKQTDVGVIPEDWEEKNLGDIVEFLKGKGLPKSVIVDSGLYKCVHYGELFTTYKESIYSIQSFTNTNEGYIFSKKNDVLMPTSDVTPNGLATASCLNEDMVILGGDILIIRVSSNILDGVFLSYYIAVNKKKIMTLVSGSTVYHLYGSDMANFKIIIPDITEQQAIATALSDIDELINSLEKLIAKKEAIKTGTMQELLTGKKRLDGFSGEWEETELKDAVEFLDHRRKPIKSGDRSSKENIYPYYGASGIIDFVDDYIFDENLILLGEDGENILSRNLPLAFTVSGKIWVNNHAHVLKPLKNINLIYLAHLLESLDYGLLNSGTAQPKLNKQSCENIRFLKPTLQEQTVIASILSDMDNNIEALKTKLSKVKAIKEGMMQELLTGKTRLIQGSENGNS